MDGHDAKIHSDQCSGNAGRLSSAVPDWSEGDSTESQWLHANLFLLPTNICAELITVLAITGAALSLWPDLLSGLWGSEAEENLLGPDKPRCQ